MTELDQSIPVMGESAQSQIFGLSDHAVDRIAASDPCTAVVLGIPVAEALTDYSPEGHEARADLTRELLAKAERLPVTGDADRIALEVMRQQFTHTLAAADSGDHLRDVNILFSPPQHLRMALEFAAPGVAPDMVAQLPAALAGWRESLSLGVAEGLPAARRQALAVGEQLATVSSNWIGGYCEERAVPDADAERARNALHDTSVWLSDVYSAQASPEDGVGEERYLRAAAAFNGLELDLADTFDWGWQEVERLTAALRSEVDRIDPSLPLTQVRAHLDADPEYQIHGVEALTAHLRQLTDRATELVDGDLFVIDPRVRECGVEIAADGAAAAPYYVPPSEDLSRPGSTWYPTRGAEVFPRWWLETVWFHEGVPGHHLQIGSIATQSQLSRFQRVLGSTSGHAEGWALYAERLADELGWFDTPGTRIGFLSAQLMRAVRVVVDIGLHTGRPVPKGFPGQHARITPESARRMLIDTALLDPDFATSEVDRYLGMPGQAISYKVGERVWWELRSDAERRLGGDFDLKDWHMTAMRLGPMGLAQFATEMGAYPRD